MHPCLRIQSTLHDDAQARGAPLWRIGGGRVCLRSSVVACACCVVCVCTGVFCLTLCMSTDSGPVLKSSSFFISSSELQRGGGSRAADRQGEAQQMRSEADGESKAAMRRSGAKTTTTHTASGEGQHAGREQEHTSSGAEQSTESGGVSSRPHTNTHATSKRTRACKH